MQRYLTSREGLREKPFHHSRYVLPNGNCFLGRMRRQLSKKQVLLPARRIICMAYLNGNQSEERRLRVLFCMKVRVCVMRWNRIVRKNLPVRAEIMCCRHLCPGKYTQRIMSKAILSVNEKLNGSRAGSLSSCFQNWIWYVFTTLVLKSMFYQLTTRVRGTSGEAV